MARFGALLIAAVTLAAVTLAAVTLAAVAMSGLAEARAPISAELRSLEAASVAWIDAQRKFDHRAMTDMHPRRMNEEQARSRGVSVDQLVADNAKLYAGIESPAARFENMTFRIDEFSRIGETSHGEIFGFAPLTYQHDALGARMSTRMQYFVFQEGASWKFMQIDGDEGRENFMRLYPEFASPIREAVGAGDFSTVEVRILESAAH